MQTAFIIFVDIFVSMGPSTRGSTEFLSSRNERSKRDVVRKSFALSSLSGAEIRDVRKTSGL